MVPNFCFIGFVFVLFVEWKSVFFFAQHSVVFTTRAGRESRVWAPFYYMRYNFFNFVTHCNKTYWKILTYWFTNRGCASRIKIYLFLSCHLPRNWQSWIFWWSIPDYLYHQGVTYALKFHWPSTSLIRVSGTLFTNFSSNLSQKIWSDTQFIISSQNSRYSMKAKKKEKKCAYVHVYAHLNKLDIKFTRVRWFLLFMRMASGFYMRCTILYCSYKAFTNY